MRSWPWTRQPKPTQADQGTAPSSQDYEQYTAYSQLLDRNGQWIGIADTKAGAILAFVVVTFPLLAAPIFPAIQKVIKMVPQHAWWWNYLPAVGLEILFGLFLIAALVTLLRVLLTLLPRLTRKTKPGLIFFSDIATQEYPLWQQRMLALDPHMLALEVLEQVHATAAIAHCKHKHVRQAIHTLIIMVSLGLVLYVFSLFIS